ncbi:hypothetical protein [Fibrella aquatica]|uniref:hypothetical protein n=1 Tax=Fibrella aquatica TaxID=3242487 RepID=UPI0035221E5E
MAESKKTEVVAEAAAALPGTGPSYKLGGLQTQQDFYVPATGRTYNPASISQDQLKQLHALKFPHVELVQPA